MNRSLTPRTGTGSPASLRCSNGRFGTTTVRTGSAEPLTQQRHHFLHARGIAAHADTAAVAVGIDADVHPLRGRLNALAREQPLEETPLIRGPGDLHIDHIGT